MRVTTPSPRRPVVHTDRNRQRRHRPDYILLLICIVLMVVGLIVIYAISPGLSVQKNVSENYFVSKQLVAIGLGVVAFLITANISIDSWKKLQIPLIALAGISALAVRLFSTRINGAYRWIQIGGLSFQAVELIKFSLLIWLAVFLSRRISEGTLNSRKETIQPLFIVLCVVGFIVAGIESDLGSTGVIVAMMAAMAFVAGLPIKKVILFGGIILIGVILAISTSAYRRDRLLTFMQPQRDCQNTGYQACQALIAVGSGGLFGKGLANGAQAYGYLPEAANDSIFAIYSEKFGFIGVVTLISLFMLFFTRLKNIMERSPDNYTRLLVTGVLAWLSTQTIINIGAMVGLLPLKGITLPFISYGGTSIIFITAVIGIVFNISRYTTFTVEGGDHEDSGQRRGHGRPHHAYLSRRT